MKTLSRQRLWQIARREEGNCQSCNKPSQYRTLCDTCAVRIEKVKYRKPLKSEWASVDWTKSNTEIAKHFDVTWMAVRYQRRKYTPDLLHNAPNSVDMNCTLTYGSPIPPTTTDK